MMKKSSKYISIPFWVILFSVCFYYVHANAIGGHDGNFDNEEGGGGGGGVYAVGGGSFLVKRDQRMLIVSTEYGQISAVKIPTTEGRKGISGSYYHLQFITLEPNALLLPLLLHSDMLFYVNTGSARLSYVDYDEDENELQHVDLSRGDVYRLQAGTFFFIQSNLETERQKLRIYAIFANSNENSLEVPSIKAYSSVQDLVLGFDKRVLRAAFNVPEDVITELKSGQPQPLIVHGVQKSKKTIWEVEAQFMKSILGSRNYGMFDFSSNKGKKTKVFNIMKAKHDVENCNGWSLSVTKKQLKGLKHSDMGVFMVNLTKGSMMGPHWNPMATEIGVVLQGRGMIRVVCSSNTSETGCENMRFRVEEGDVFAIPRFHPMAQISYNNESFVFMGFTTASKKNHPQFLAGKRSVLQTLDKLVLAASFQVNNETIDRLLAPQEESIILECTSCAENEEAVMEEEVEREREREEERRREEEESRKREEEKRREEEEARKREEEEAKRRQEEKRRREEEEEAEARRKEEEEAAREREEEEAKRKEKRKREEEEEEEEERRREEEEASRREEERRRREAEQEEAAARRQEEEQARQQEEERERQQEKEAEEERRREEEEARQQEEERERQEEEEAARKEEKRRKREAEQEEEAARRQEQEAARQQEEERERQQEEEERERQQEEEGETGHGEREEEEGEEAAARREDEERQRRAAEEEAEARERETEEEGEGRRIPIRFRRV